MSSLIIAAWTRVNGVTWAHHTLLYYLLSTLGGGKQEQGTVIFGQLVFVYTQEMQIVKAQHSFVQDNDE